MTDPWAPPTAPAAPGGPGGPAAAWGGWGAPPAPRRRPRVPRGAVAVAAALALVLPTGVVRAVQEHRVAALRAELLAELPRLRAFVEERSGRAFREEVAVEVLADRDFQDALTASGTEPAGTPGDPEDAGATLTALGLVDGPESFDEQLAALTATGTLGFYDTSTDRLVVRATQPGPFLESVLVHELTHALQDQYTDLERIDELPTDTEEAAGFLALVEGDASRVERDYRAALPAASRERADREEAAQAAAIDLDALEDPVVTSLLAFPYGPGLQLVDLVASTGGTEAIAAAFADPPTTTEQVLHPLRYVAREPALPVDRPDAAGEVVDVGVLGELGLALLLDGGGTDEVGGEAAEGWGGDAYVTTERGDGWCVAAEVRMDSGPDRDELLEALVAWAEAQPDAVAAPRGRDGVRFTACR